MKTIRTNQLTQNVDQIIKINGWVYNSRCSGKIGFLMLRDGYGIVQCIIEKNHVGEGNFEQFISSIKFHKATGDGHDE